MSVRIFSLFNDAFGYAHGGRFVPAGLHDLFRWGLNEEGTRGTAAQVADEDEAPWGLAQKWKIGSPVSAIRRLRDQRLEVSPAICVERGAVVAIPQVGGLHHRYELHDPARPNFHDHEYVEHTVPIANPIQGWSPARRDGSESQVRATVP